MKRFTSALVLLVLFGVVPVSVSAQYRVCLGSFAETDNAVRFQAELAAAGYLSQTEFVRVGDTDFVRVLSGYVYDDRAEAAAAMRQLSRAAVIRRHGITDVWIVPGASASAATGVSVAAGPAPERGAPSSPAGTLPSETLPPETPALKTSSPEVLPSETVTPVPGPPPAGDSASIRVIHSEGYGNCVFATEEIGLGQEARVTLTETITAPEPIYARCYLPGPVGVVAGENFWHELWIDGRLVSRTFFKEPPDPEWDQIQIWVSEDEYADQIGALGPGEHEIIIWVMKNESHGERAVAGTNAAGEIVAGIEEVWVPVRLSKGSLTYVVE